MTINDLSINFLSVTFFHWCLWNNLIYFWRCGGSSSFRSCWLHHYLLHKLWWLRQSLNRPSWCWKLRIFFHWWCHLKFFTSCWRSFLGLIIPRPIDLKLNKSSSELFCNLLGYFIYAMYFWYIIYGIYIIIFSLKSFWIWLLIKW